MPIIFENRLGNSESDRKLRKIYRSYNILWTSYYFIFIAGLGFGAAILIGAEGNPILALIVAAATASALVLLLKSQARRRRRGSR